MGLGRPISQRPVSGPKSKRKAPISTSKGASSSNRRLKSGPTRATSYIGCATPPHRSVEFNPEGEIRRNATWTQQCQDKNGRNWNMGVEDALAYNANASLDGRTDPSSTHQVSFKIAEAPV